MRQAGYADLSPVPREEAAAHAELHGFDYLRPLTEPSLQDDPHHVRCKHCGHLSAQRLGDIGFGCSCQVNAKRSSAARRESETPKPPALFKDSGVPAVQWWDHERNTAEEWATTRPRARREVWWRCPECLDPFQARVLDMANSAQCPVCEPKRRAAYQAQYERYKRTPVAAVPELAAAWADDADPATVPVAGEWKLRRFRCPQGHHPRISPLTYLESGCPHCRARRTAEEKLAALEVDPGAFGMNPEIAAQWHPTKNGKLSVERTSPTSRRTVWWREESCGHEWQATPADREKGQRLRCPHCRTILDSLAYHFPLLATQWAPENPVSAWHVRPTAVLAFLPRWQCPQDSSHTWQSPVGSRTVGSGCPMCKEAGKSAIELEMLEAARSHFGNATSGRPLRDQAFTARSVWHPDITVELASGQTLVIEYDGAYWHSDKAEVDTAKSRDLLAAGYLVMRLREHPLPPLTISSERYGEAVVYANAPDPRGAVEDVARWVREATRKR
ncbi:zinc-ribbon domain-containing protein [Georgenia faecalis]|uniref:Zinc-ribbon domain-containing protein n=1 Tax=Georgenia faecalis TaxID=2483799 RepID=A0ABV9DBI0_9MICO